MWYLTVLGIARSWRGNYDLRVRKKLRAGLAIMHGFSGYGKNCIRTECSRQGTVPVIWLATRCNSPHSVFALPAAGAEGMQQA